MTSRRAKTKASKSAEPHQLVADAAVRAVGLLAASWPGKRYDLLRAVVVHALYAEVAVAYGMRAVPIAMVMPDMPTEATAGLHGILSELPLADLTPEHFGAAHEALSGYTLRDGVVEATDARRGTGVHFTPRSLTEPIVAKTLEPLLVVVPPEKTLDLRICDPAVGAGAFLLELVRQLGARAYAADLAATRDQAKRLVAIQCAYGTDICRFAVQAAKLALTLECRADAMPVGWLDHNVRWGDALVGLSRDQIAAFHWAPKEPRDLLESAERARFGKLVDDAINAGAAARRQEMARLAALARGAA